MTDVIALRGIRAWGHHGADPGEQDVAQPLDLDLVLDVDLGAARRSDELADTIDYAAVHAAVLHVVAAERWRLLERLGERILQTVMADPRVESATVTIAKPGLLAGATPSVTVRRRRAAPR